nr:MAG TPA: hypothetical protein [Caudoviricetes sp.]
MSDTFLVIRKSVYNEYKNSVYRYRNKKGNQAGDFPCHRLELHWRKTHACQSEQTYASVYCLSLR